MCLHDVNDPGRSVVVALSRDSRSGGGDPNLNENGTSLLIEGRGRLWCPFLALGMARPQGGLPALLVLSLRVVRKRGSNRQLVSMLAAAALMFAVVAPTRAEPREGPALPRLLADPAGRGRRFLWGAGASIVRQQLCQSHLEYVHLATTFVEVLSKLLFLGEVLLESREGPLELPLVGARRSQQRQHRQPGRDRAFPMSAEKGVQGRMNGLFGGFKDA